MPAYNPCIACGACCAFFRASFYWAESDLATPGGVPHMLTDHLQTHYLVMKGTNCSDPRCIALKGVIGDNVYCAIYARRASVCRNFIPSFENGQANERCDRARARWGLPPLDSDSWTRPQPDNFPKAA
ncbi:MAG: YkgJ family cysteine cluster protein [Desulfobulbaceae bacterium]|jgi:Fe-S-cluster containining protein|nr:YkgJ family cysteine cluster protein [Desulfobulbaceae bacterium]MDY0350466.1 YkgJ family cysteine cluster protein [Desulfobulbaceae bacterium]